MAKINLLPWRAERRAQRQKEFYAMLGLAAAAGVLFSFAIWFHYSQQISGQNVRNQYLQAEIAKVEQQIVQIEALDKQKDRLLARKKVIEQLQANRSQMVHLFDSLVRTIPDGVALANIKQEGDILTLEGRSQSNARVSTYMRNLEGSGWMTNPDLSIIEAKKQETGAAAVSSSDSRALPYVFTLKVKLANPSATDEKTGLPMSTAPVAAEQPVEPATITGMNSTPAAETATPAATAPPDGQAPLTEPAAPATEGSPES